MTQGSTTQDPEPLDGGHGLSGKVAMVTGAARGIGRACALRLAAAGADVVVVDRDLAAAKEFGEQLTASGVAAEVAALGRRSAEYELDLVDAQATRRLVAEVAGRFGRIDVLVAMAGGAITPMEGSLPSTMPAADVERVFQVNLTTAVNTAQAVAPVMVGQGSGSIVTVTGASAIAAFPGGRLAHYGAAKLAVLHYTRSLASELGPAGVRANCVSPGTTLSSRVAAQAQDRGLGTAEQAAAVPLGRLGTPEDIAGAVLFLAGDLAGFVTGQCLSVCGGAVMTPS
jgi:NAD(P)-dependent dehydrogenase (short-subunit alcohol dehydrogenase family)